MSHNSLQIIQIDPNNRRQVKQFLGLPFRLYKDVPQWVPPLRMDARLVFNQNKHPFYKRGEAAFFIAVQDGSRLRGRLAVLNDRSYNAYNQTRIGFFYLFECENDETVAEGLFSAAFTWAIGRGLDCIYGPKGFSLFDGLGILVRGFERRPAFGLPYNLPYYPDLIEKQGFVSVGDSVSGYLDDSMRFPDKIFQISDLIKERRGLRVPLLKNRRDLKAVIPKLKELYNSSIMDMPGNAPISDEDIQAIANQMLWFADPHLIKLVMKGDQPVGFLLAYPDISAAVQRTGGRLLPFGWIDLLLELRRTKWININGAGMTSGFRGLGGTALLFSEMYKSVSESRYRFADIVQVGEENDKMQREMRDLGIDFYKAHRIYEKKL